MRRPTASPPVPTGWRRTVSCTPHALWRRSAWHRKRSWNLQKRRRRALTRLLDVADPAAAVMASELYEARANAFSHNDFLLIPQVPKQTLSAILRGRIEESTGLALLQSGNPPEATIRFRRAMSVLPKDSAWWRSALWNLGSSLEAEGKNEEALRSYINSYKTDRPRIGRYLAINALYKKVNGTSDGLEAEIGPSPLANVVASTQPVDVPAPSPSPAPETTPVVLEPANAPKPLPRTLPVATEDAKPIEVKQVEVKPAEEKPPAEKPPAETPAAEPVVAVPDLKVEEKKAEEKKDPPAEPASDEPKAEPKKDPVTDVPAVEEKKEPVTTVPAVEEKKEPAAEPVTTEKTGDVKPAEEKKVEEVKLPVEEAPKPKAEETKPAPETEGVPEPAKTEVTKPQEAKPQEAEEKKPAEPEAKPAAKPPAKRLAVIKSEGTPAGTKAAATAKAQPIEAAIRAGGDQGPSVMEERGSRRDIGRTREAAGGGKQRDHRGDKALHRRREPGGRYDHG